MTYIDSFEKYGVYTHEINLNKNGVNRFYISYEKIFENHENMMDTIFDEFFDEYISNPRLNNKKDFISKEDFDKYIINIKQLEKFIQVFKPSLQEILIDKVEKKDIYVCRKVFKYKDYQIDSEFESTGIKKLITYFNAFRDLNNGMIVFIDELDANLHDVYLCKLLEYLCLYSKGQLCFTTHNLAPMDILKKRNYSIDFLSDNSQITSWTKNGNYSVTKLYKEGMINNSPFNIESFDFIGIFEE